MANFDAAKAIFSQVDVNRDGNIDQNEFRSWISGGGGGGAGGLNSSSYESSSFQSGGGGFDASSGLGLSGGVGLFGYGEAGGYGGNAASYSSQSGYESAGGYGGNAASYSSQSGYESAGGLATGGFDSSYGGALSSGLVQAGGSTFESSSVQQVGGYPSADGLYNDPNPQFIRRQAIGGPITYQQNIRIRFLQPPPVPPPGPLIIKEVRPPQPPPPPPLVIRQRAPAPLAPPPLILRERPPVPPASIAGQTLIRRLAALPVPPRSVIIERLPPLPPKPRDVIIERWIPYGPQAKRRTIVQRAPAPAQYARPRNIIVVYDAIQARVVRQFQRIGVTPENPQAYLARYGASLLDTGTLLQQARAAGVVEDISPPAGVASAQFSGSAYGVDVGVGGGAGFDFSSASSGGAFGFDGFQGVGGGAAGFDYSGASLGGAVGFNGFQGVGGAEGGSYGLGVASNSVDGGYSSQSYSSSSYGSGGGFAGGAGFDALSAGFAAADTNRDGGLDRAEFQRFVQGGL